MNVIDSKEDLGVLRFITAGSVDDGKSTLIGRLLYDSKSILSDHLSALLSLSKNRHMVIEEFDLSLITDGLEAEREQGITIDVAYRYFATTQRNFIIADTPGHEQYTRNMVTGASTAHAAIILIDGARISVKTGEVQLLPQTKRHSVIVKLLGLQHVIVAVNKMDLINYSEILFNNICDAYISLMKQIGLSGVHFVPVSALKGDNIVIPSKQMPWYTGKSLLNLLEILQVQSQTHDVLRFPVQYVVRQDGSLTDSFRGYMGRIESGEVKIGDEIIVYPSKYTATVDKIISPIPGCTALVSHAYSGQNVIIHLSKEIDVSRGDMLVPLRDLIIPARILEVDLCWFDDIPLSLHRKYLLKQTTSTVLAKIIKVNKVLDIHTLLHATDRRDLKMNDIGRVILSLQKPIVCDIYDSHPGTGSIILIDEVTHQTVAAGMIRAFSATSVA
ncbi:MAG: GTP-binding protein [Burkholderia sp.]|nr:GTP-binding protein [Burkholderia sp.]